MNQSAQHPHSDHTAADPVGAVGTLTMPVPAMLLAKPPAPVIAFQTPSAQRPPSTLIIASGDSPRTPLSAVKAPVATPREVTECEIPFGLVFKGEASFPCDVRITGEIEGTVRAGNGRTITIDPQGKVSGELTATNVRIEGRMDGAVDATGGLASFGPKSICTGSILYGRVSVDEGADVEASMKKALAKA